MDKAIEIHVGSLITKQEVKKRGGKKKKNEKETGAASTIAQGRENRDYPEVEVSLFDCSVENHFRAIDTISVLCGERECAAFEESHIRRLSPTVTFLREWKHFNYKPKAVRFSCENGNGDEKDVLNGINLPQFSAAAVPKRRLSSDTPPEARKDFVLYTGGPVWALDWCPRANQRLDCHIRCEFIAVAAHPPESSYHKIGAPLIGRGMIQIWCLLNETLKEEVLPPTKKTKQKAKSTGDVKDKSTQPKKPRGRPRKKPITANDPVCDGEFIEALAVEFPVDSSEDHVMIGVSKYVHKHDAQKNSGKRQNSFSDGLSADNSALRTSMQKRRLKNNSAVGSYRDIDSVPFFTQNGEEEASITNLKPDNSSGQDLVLSGMNVSNDCSLESNPVVCSIPKDLVLPRIVLCLAHNGKVAWDVKWRPSNVCDSECKPRMGYLAVLLGNGALEVWEVPSPHLIKVLYSSSNIEGTDPRFLKLDPVFRCSKLNCGNRQSIPLTMEWSASYPHDFIVAGCHDGTVALWKFCASDSSQDTRPFLCFNADTVPIRALAWAPVENDPEGANIIVTAGHEGLKFWDIRDPFRPLWDLNPVRRVIYSLDWLRYPKCIILSFDDGTLRILSLGKAACDTPVTGKPFGGTQQQGLHCYYCSPFSIWGVQASRLTGTVAYCSADGSVVHFQLTTKAVEKDPSRNRVPHFLCGSLTEEDSTLTVNTPLPDIPFPMKKSLNEWANAPRTIRRFLYESNQAKRASDHKAKGQNLDDQVPALCYGDDLGVDFESENTSAPPKGERTLKSRTSIEKNSKNDQAQSRTDEEPENMKSKETANSGTSDEVEVFPPKIVAMHKVRWNMNKGSERWLCYGGAAGILRCQEIHVYNADKKSLLKR